MSGSLDLLLVRHAPTRWNRERRLQGHRDLPIEPAVAERSLPCSLAPCWRARRWYTSPLLRARQSAARWGLAAQSAPALIEMHWGEWEGSTLAALRAADPRGMAAAEARGLDLRAPGGESPREVQARVSAWADQLLDEGAGGAVAAVVHKGVIRALYAAASGWDMCGPPPRRLDDRCGQRLLRRDGRWAVVALNLPLAPPPPGSAAG